MFALGLQYLAGVVYATDVASREQPEWPPHPDRVFMALVAAHHETEADPGEREALRWLERLGPPAIAASATGQPRHAVTSFVPVNDTVAPRLSPRQEPSSAQLAAGMGLLPDARSRQPRNFPAIVPHDPTVFLIWPDVSPDPHLWGHLDDLCRKVVRVGHSASLVQMWVDLHPPAPTLEPTTALPHVRLRVPGDGRLAALEARYPRLRPAPGRWAAYGRSESTSSVPAVRGSAFREDLLVFRRVSGRLLGLESTALLADTARRALLALAAQPVPEWISGHALDGSPSAQSHVAMFPLADVGHAHADGHLLGLALAVPRAIQADQLVGALGGIVGVDANGELRRFAVFDGNLLDWSLELDSRTTRPVALESQTWTASPAGALVWASVTPVVLDRFPKKEGDTERILAMACERAGLPTPVGVVSSPVSLVAGSPTARAMPPLMHPSGGGTRMQTHVVITFAEPVCGPIMVGAGRYRGYGLCRPLSSPGA